MAKIRTTPTVPASVGAVRLERVALTELSPADYNPRRISDRALAGLGHSIEHFGVVQPLVVNRRSEAKGWPAGSKRTVVSGHQRLRALLARGVVSSDVVVVDLAEYDEKALNVASNSQAISGEWTDGVRALLAEIERAVPDLCERLLLPELDRSLDAVLGKVAAAPLEDPPAPPPPAEPVSKLGDLLLLGEHRLICGDCTDPAVVARALDGASPRLLLTDPPYGVELDMEWRDRAGLNALGPAEASYMRRGEGHRNTSISGDTRADWSAAFELVPSLDTAYVWHASAFSIEVGTGLRRIGLELKQQIIWRKPHFTLSRQHYHWQHEPCWYARKPGSTRFRGARDQSTIWDAASPKMLMSGSTEEKVDHPTQKPLVLYTRPIENHLRRGEVLYEPFAGSGTAIMAAEKTGRRCIAVEIDPRFCDVIALRFEQLSGKRAKRVRAKA